MANHSANALQKLFEKSITKMQQGKAVEARSGFIKLSRQLPHSAVVWYNLGLCHQHLGSHPFAVDCYKKCLQLSPTQLDAMTNLGISYNELGKFAQAEETVNSVLSHNDRHPRALNLLATLLAEKPDVEKARDTFRRCLEIEPYNVDAKVNLANLEFGSGNMEIADRLTNELFDAFPDELKVRLLKGRMLITQQHYNEASPLVGALEKSFPKSEEVLRLGLSFREAVRDHFGAINFAEAILKIVPNDAKTLNSLGGAWFQLDGISQSKEYYEKAFEIDPDNAEYANNLGLVYSSLGDKAGAEAFYRKSLELNPGHAEAYRSIATMKKFKSIEDEDAATVIELWGKSDDLDDSSKIKLSFALGKIYDDCGLYKQAFEVYKVGNDLKYQDSRIDLNKYYRHINSIGQILDRKPAATSSRRFKHKPVFVLGMPRSGTTLVEQVLSRHSHVLGCGELPCIEEAIARIEKRSDPMRAYPGDFTSLSTSELDKAADHYLDWVHRLHDLNVDCFVDKMPFNFAHVWLIKSLFPDSRIIHCRRHPLDVITSNYFQLYGSDIGFVYNLKSLANYYIQYHQLMKHWNDLFKGEIYPVIYEQFVGDNENQTKALIDGAGLEWQENCLDSTKSNTAVRTASIWQVREGIYTRSRERWRNYENPLAEVIDILQHAQILDDAADWVL